VAFAIVAYPVAYGASGVTTFMINQDAVVYQKDLGSGTSQAVSRMTRSNRARAGRKRPERASVRISAKRR
jgi:Protein of unknown function (DUF2950)